MASHWRHDPITDRRVRIAPRRAERPNDFERADTPRCPFCAGAERDTPPEIDRVEDPSGQWLARVIPNLYPALEPPDGRQEVIIEGPRHVTRFADLPAEQATAAVVLWARRIAHWRASNECGHVVLFKNEGRGAGASLAHTHSQLAVLSDAPETVAAAWRRIAAASDSHEIEVFRCGSWRVVSPLAPRFAFETWIRPSEPASDWETLADSPGAASELATLIQRTGAAACEAAATDSWNLVVQTPPRARAGADSRGWIELVPRNASIAGLELATGLWTNATPPELAADRLRTLLRGD